MNAVIQLTSLQLVVFNFFLLQVIGTELYRNILLAMLVVFIVTFFIIANPMTSFLVFLCVAFTVVSASINKL